MDNKERICFLIGSIYFYGNFKAETANERELEKLLREEGFFFDSEDQLMAALKQQKAGAATSPNKPMAKSLCYSCGNIGQKLCPLLYLGISGDITSCRGHSATSP